MKFILTLVHSFILVSLLISLTLCTAPSTEQSTSVDGLLIDIWYGPEQHFGQLGMPQQWVNILGSVSPVEGLQSLTYILNEEEPTALTTGEDGRRLANPGDFNIDIDTARLETGKNTVLIAATDSSGNKTTEEVIVHYTSGNTWDLPYTIEWNQVENIQDIAQIVDGHWQLEEGGVRTLDPYYDRVLAFGDNTWTDYEVTTTVTFHDFTPPQKGPPTFNVSHAAIATRWPGHDLDDNQPHTKWYPVGATAEFRLTTHLDSCRWRIFDGENLYVEDTTKLRFITLGTRYHMKHRVESQPDGSTLYSVKFWEDEQPEPEVWDLQAKEPPGNISSGSALLIAHNTDVTFGNVKVVSLYVSDFRDK